MEDLLRNASLGIVGAGIIGGSVVLLGASAYDIAYTIKRRSLEARKHSAKRVKRPSFTIIVYSHNQSRATIECLESIVKTSYRKYKVIVVDDASKDGTSADVMKFIKARKKRSIRLVSKKRFSGPQKALESALKMVKSDFVLALNPDYSLSSKALGIAADRFTFIDTDALMPAIIVGEQPSILNLWSKYKNIASLVRQKTLSLISGQGGSFRYGIFYRAKVLRAKTMNVTGIYASDVMLRLAKKPNIAQPKLTYYGLISRRDGGGINVPSYIFKLIGLIINLAILPLFLWYSLFTALNDQYPGLIVISFLLFSFFTLVAVWSVEQLNIIQKIKYSVLAPAMFSLFFVMAFVNAVGLILQPLLKLPFLRKIVPSAGFIPHPEAIRNREGVPYKAKPF